jgi:hypothetical protein
MNGEKDWPVLGVGKKVGDSSGIHTSTRSQLNYLSVMHRVFQNGPLPDFLESVAYIPEPCLEFALYLPDALKYLDWCDQQGFRVRGYEVWVPTSPYPTVMIGVGADGNSDLCRYALTHDDFSGYLLRFQLEPVFCVYANATADPDEAK